MTAPAHIAVIMDGNGRWALERGRDRLSGHRAGAKTLENMLHWCRARGVKYLTVYAFSTENWRRPEAEVSGLMKLLGTFIRTKASRLVKDGIRFRVIGRRDDLPAKLRQAVEKLEKRTEGGAFQLIVALSYGGRAEIVDAVKSCLRAVSDGALSPEGVDEAEFARHLYAPDVPDPDLIIRTSGEKRTSNFLLWESAYSEYHFTDVLWPDFSESDLELALADYAGRDRRRGGHR
jgi:undecaprenyl diphosphate synthase